jgi:hypothetical protein
MRTTHTTRSAATGLGAAALLGIIVAGPALADPAPIGAAESTQTKGRPLPPPRPMPCRRRRGWPCIGVSYD